MAELFQYEPGIKYDVNRDTPLHAFSYSDEGVLYFWNKSADAVTAVGAEIDGDPRGARHFHLPAVSGGANMNLGTMMGSRKARREVIDACTAYVDGARYIEKIIDARREEEAANRIVKVSSVRKTSGGLEVRAFLRNIRGESFMKDFRIEKCIRGFERIEQLLTENMERTKDRCGKCGGTLADGICTVCHTPDYFDRNSGKVKVAYVLIAVGVVMFLAGIFGMIFTSGQYSEEGMGTGIRIFGIVGFAGIVIGCIGAGIRYKYKK